MFKEMNLRRITQNLSLCIIAIAFCLLSIEVLLRIIEPATSGFDFVMQRPGTGRLYELRPGAKGILLGRTITINSFGIRDREFEKVKSSDVLRVIGLGDSVTMGWGIDANETYLSVLERELNAASKKRFEILNFGVCGYNTEQEVDFFEAKGADLKPDLVLVGFFTNDARPSESMEVRYVSKLQKLVHKSYLLKLLSPHFAALGRIFKIPIKTYVSTISADYSDGLPGWVACQNALKRLQMLSLRHKFRLAVVMIPMTVSLDSDYPFNKVHEKLEVSCREQGIMFWDALPVFLGRNPRSLRVSYTDAHYNSLAHHMLAEFIKKKLVDLDF